MPSRYTQYGGAAGADHALREMVAERIATQMQQHEIERQRQGDARAERQLRVSEDTAKFNREAQQEQSDQVAAQRRQTVAHTLASDLAPEDALDPQQVATLRAGNLGSNVEHQPMTLPSRAITGYATTPERGKPSTGFLRTVQQPGQGERDVYRGTPTQRHTQEQQRQLQQWISQLPADSPQRMALEYQAMTGNNPPAALFPRAPTAPTARYSAHPMFDETGNQTGIGAFNNITGDMRPVNSGGGFLRSPGGGASSRQLPGRVENFLMQLRSKHPRYDEAMAELAPILANAQGETFSHLAAATALRQLYAQPAGNDPSSGLDVASILGTGGRSSGSGPSRPTTPSSAPASTGGRVTRAELRAVAQQLGISEQDASQQARARGLAVE